MARTPIESKNIQDVEFDPVGKTLHVQFHPNPKTGKASSGKYHGVDEELFQAFMDSPSKGRFLHQSLKPGAPWEPDPEKTDDESPAI